MKAGALVLVLAMAFAFSPAAMAQEMAVLAERHDRLVVKVPDSAGSKDASRWVCYGAGERLRRGHDSHYRHPRA